MGEAHKKHLTREELKEKALEWFKPAHANFLFEQDQYDGSGTNNTNGEGGVGSVAPSSILLLIIPLLLIFFTN